MVLLTVFMFLIILIFIYPFQVIKYNTPYKILTPIVKAGGQIEYQRNSDKFINLEGNLSCSFQDDLIYTLPSETSNLSVGLHTEKEIIDVPINLPPATYTYRCVVTYKLLGLRDLRYEFYTDSFQVIK